MKPSTRPLLPLLALVLLAASVHAQPRTVDGVAIDPDAELIVALADDTNNMDPRIGMGSIRSNYIRQVYESLVDVDQQGKPVPGLATAWRAVNDMTWEFSLRRGVTFHDGEPFNADTVIFNLDRFFRKNLDKHGIKDVTAATSFEKVYPFVTRWEKVDDATVRIVTNEPSPNLWDFIGREPMVPRAYTVKHGVDALNDKPNGTGPWKVVEWKRKDHMSFERNDKYWGTPALVRRMRFQVIPEAAARLAALRASQVHVVEAVPPLDAGVLARDPAVKVVSKEQKLACRVYLNARPRDKYESGGKDGAFGDARVRMALNLAINRDAIIKKIFHGYALAIASPVPTVSYGYAPQEPYAYDPKKARALLSEAGFKDVSGGWVDKNGEALTLQLVHPAKHYGQSFDEMTPAVAEMLKEIGVPVTIRQVDFGSLLQMVQKGTLAPNGGFTACRTSNNLDADDFLRDWSAVTMVNWAPYSPELLDTYRATRREVDTKKRLKLLADFQRQVRDWAPIIPLYQEVKIYATSARVLKFVPLPELNMDFRGVALRK
jgi:peptide/nickel transport system substrate-binding protein